MLRRIVRVCRDYRRAHGRWPNILWPRRFTEKIQRRKLFGRNPVFTILCDKLAVRDYITARVGDANLVPLLWAGAGDVPFGRLTPPYVLKSSHASGQVILVGADDAPDFQKMQACALGWLAEPYGVDRGEQAYAKVPRRLMVEAMVTTAAGGVPEERRLFVFDGKVAVINTVFIEDGKVRNGAFHTPAWERLDWYFNRRVARDFPSPQMLGEMIRVAERLGAGLDHVRVDLYDCGDSFRIGELTLYSWSGLSKFRPDAADFILGRFWRQRWWG
jgi:hypothetical protein